MLDYGKIKMRNCQMRGHQRLIVEGRCILWEKGMIEVKGVRDRASSKVGARNLERKLGRLC
jgi:hypothetical protein